MEAGAYRVRVRPVAAAVGLVASDPGAATCVELTRPESASAAHPHGTVWVVEAGAVAVGSPGVAGTSESVPSRCVWCTTETKADRDSIKAITLQRDANSDLRQRIAKDVLQPS